MSTIPTTIKIVECPRDAMQGLHDFIPTQTKINYLNQLLQVGFHTLDFGSFVSPKAIPQMRDTADVLSMLDLSTTQTELLAIVANSRGAKEACQHEQISYIGYPFSISETFQLRNTNATLDESLERLSRIKEIGDDMDKKIVVYLSMGFGNPYGDAWNVEIVKNWTQRLVDLGFSILSLSDTIGVANPASIEYLFSNLIPAFPEVEFGAHMHTSAADWKPKVESAFKNGCRRFDSAIKGYGGCPMAQDDLIGNMPTENLIYYFDSLEIDLKMDYRAFSKSVMLASEVFPQ
jgi:hydroxymethylglutaryl-CoA lyase